MMCGIDEAINHIKNNCYGFAWEELVIARLDYHRKQAEGVKPNLQKGSAINDYYTCGNCGHTIRINDNFCPECGYRIKWNTTRCLTGLPLTDAVEGG